MPSCRARRFTEVRSRSALAVSATVALLAGVALPVVAASQAWAAHETLSISDASRTEGTIGSAPAVFTVTLSAASTSPVAVNYSTVNGTATAGSDYTATSGTVTFPPGQVTRTVSVQVTGDTLDEPDETFSVNLSDSVSATIADGEGVGTIADDDAPPRLSIDDGIPNPVVESGASPLSVTFTATLSAPSGRPVTVDYATADGTATAASDYTAGTGTLTFDPGQTSTTATVGVLDDAADENNETFAVNLTNAANATILDSQGVGTIVDDDGPPTLSIGDVTVTEGNAGSANAVFTVALTPASARTVTVGYSTANATATAGTDYTATSGTATFAPGATTATVAVPVLGDTVDEADEAFGVNLANAVNAVVTDARGAGTITDDDAGSVLAITDRSTFEGSLNVTPFSFTVSLAPASAQPVTVAYATADGTAGAPGDYVSQSGTLSFAAGQTSRTVTVNVVGDLAPEPTESFFVDLSAPANATIADSRGVATIVNDDGGVSTLSIGDATVTEGNTGSVTATFTVTLSPSATQTVTVAYATADGTASAPGDYAAAAGTLVFSPGDSTKVVNVAVNGDTLDEDAETFLVNLSSALNAEILDGQGQGTITDNDNAPALSIGDTTVTEGDLATTNATVAVTLSPASGRPVTVAYETADATATAGSDYTATSGTITFAPGETTKSVSVAVVADAVDEADEAFTFDLAGAVNATIADAQGQVTITDDDAAPSLSVNDASLPEGNSGTTAAVFTVTLSAASARIVTVQHLTADGTATTADGDYTATPGTLTFAPGETSKEVAVDVNGDTTGEPNETFTLDLSGATNATVADGRGVGTIVDDDGPPELSIGDATVTEPDTGTATALFTVRLLPASPGTVSVDYATTAGTATAESDYTSTAGTLTFVAGETEKTINVAVLADTTDEADEAFTVTLTLPPATTGVTIGDGQGTGTIVDNDVAPALSIGDVTVTEGNSGTTPVLAAQAAFTVTLSAASSQAVTVAYATADGTATAPGDYTATSGSLTFAPGDTVRTVTVVINGDTADEADEVFVVNLSAAVNAGIADGQGSATITDDESGPSLSVGDVTVAEGNAGTSDAAVTVTLAPASGQLVTVGYTTADGTASAPGDYTTVSGILAFAPGETTKQVLVPVAGDTLDEPDEAFTVVLSGATNASLSDPGAVVTVTDDDAAPSIAVNDVAVPEGNAGTTAATFAVTLSAASGRTVTASYATADDTATGPSDYVAASGTVVFEPGQTTRAVEVAVNGDTSAEPDERFSFNLSAAGDVTIADAQGFATITNDDGTPPSLAIGDVTLTEGNAGTTDAVFTVTRTGTTAQAVTVDFTTGDGTARAPADYTTTSGTVTFAPAESTRTITVAVAGDTLDEDDKTFTVTLSRATNATIADAQAVATIVDDDTLPALSINDVSIQEGASGSTNATFTVTLSSISGRAVSVAYATVNGSAGAPSDYATTNGTLTIAAGQASGSVSVPVRGDTLVEVNETFNVDLSVPVNATVARARGVGTIVNDDQVPAPVPPPAARSGYWLVASDGGIFAFGGARFSGSTGAIKLNRPIVASASTPSGNGYWLVASDGGIFAFGDAAFRGSTGAIALNRPIVGMASTPSGNGYWLVASDGGIFAFGDAAFRGSTGAIKLNKPIVGLASTPSGNGYWLVASDGGIFAFGDAAFRGSTGALRLNLAIVGMTSTPSGGGYWLVASDGGIFAFGDAAFAGSTGAIKLNRPIVGMASTPSGNGYWLVASDGGIFAFGGAVFAGSTGAIRLNLPIVGMAAVPR